ncbi:MAG: hypothetical protein LBJ21_07080, partial [Acidobacteriota bacterium]|nr:hypothetical protein [Acidobacteriota bacterium]
MIFALLLPLCACATGNTNTAAEIATKKEAVSDAVVSEENNPLGSLDEIHPVPEGVLEGLDAVSP